MFDSLGNIGGLILLVLIGWAIMEALGGSPSSSQTTKSSKGESPSGTLSAHPLNCRCSEPPCQRRRAQVREALNAAGVSTLKHQLGCACSDPACQRAYVAVRPMMGGRR